MAPDAGNSATGVYGWLLGFGLRLRQAHLCGHNPLPFGDQTALGTGAVLEATVPLVTLEPGDDAVVAAAGALGLARPLLGGGVGQRLALHGAGGGT